MQHEVNCNGRTSRQPTAVFDRKD